MDKMWPQSNRNPEDSRAFFEEGNRPLVEASSGVDWSGTGLGWWTSACEAALSVVQQGAVLGGLYEVCSNAGDVAKLALGYFQGIANCYSLATQGARVPGYLNLGRGGASELAQCGACGINVCPMGMLCAPNEPARLCPAGSYCPDAHGVALPCPSGSYCTIGSSQPTACSLLAACPAGATRPITWVPLLIAGLLFAAVVGLQWYATTVPLRHHAAAAATSGGGKIAPSLTEQLQPEIGGVPILKSSLPPIEIKFEDLKLVSSGNPRLAGVSGLLRAGRMSAIIGGSGAGKTSLASVLLEKERATLGKVTIAEVLRDGTRREMPHSALRPMLGFVPQVDILLEGLTVRETLEHSAYTRAASDGRRCCRCLFGSGSMGAQKKLVEDVLDALQLRPTAGVTLGDALDARSALSSGERKRVSIGTEVAANPRVLFLDEPTTGLDSTSALDCISCLSAFTRAGLTVACIIHQPRAEVIALFDDVILLGKGGRLVYSGPQAYLAPYFSSHLGFSRAPMTSNTDFVMDSVEGACGWQSRRISLATVDALSATPVSAELSTPADAVALPSAATPSASAHATSHAGGSGDESGINVSDLAAELSLIWSTSGSVWVEERQRGREDSALKSPSDKDDPILPPPSVATASSLPTHSLPSSAASSFSSSSSSSAAAAGSSCSFFLSSILDFPAQFFFYTRRALLQHICSPSLILDLTSIVGGGIVMGIVSCNDPIYTPPPPRIYAQSCPKGAEGLCMDPMNINFGGFLFYISIAMGVLSAPAAVRSMGADRHVFWRESGVGANSLAYFLAKCTADTPKIALMAFFFQAPMIAIAPWLSPPGKMWLIIFLTMLCVSGVGRILSAAVGSDIDSSNLIAVNVAIILNLFCGWVPLIGSNGSWVYTHWTMRALTATELIEGQSVSTEMYDRYAQKEWRTPNVPMDLLALLLIGLGTNAIAYAVLLCRFRDKQR